MIYILEKVMLHYSFEIMFIVVNFYMLMIGYLAVVLGVRGDE